MDRQLFLPHTMLSTKGKTGYMFQKRRVRGLFLLVTMVCAGIGSLQIIAGASATSGSVATPLPTVPSQSPSEIQKAAESAQPVDEVQTGPELSLTEVQHIALKYAGLAQEPSPSKISVAQGSFADAQAIMESSIGGQAPSGKVPWSDSSVYLVVMHGNFTLDDVPTPPERKSPTGTVMGLILDAHTGFREGRSLGVVAPNLEALGPVVRLSTGG
jgi:hypothetical protein